MNIITLDDIYSTFPVWLWKPYIPFGKVTIIQGDPGDGKTTLILHIAAALSRGEVLHMDIKCKPSNIIYLNAEDGYADTIKPRLEAANADCRYIHTIDETDSALTMTDERIEAAIRLLDAKMLIIDPMQAYLGADVDMHRANEIRPVMSRLAVIAENTGCAIVIIGHMNKAQGMKASYRGLGSIDFTAAARSVLVVARDKSNPNLRVMAQIKNSLAPEGKPIAFEICDEEGVKLLGEYVCDIDDMLMGIGTDCDFNEAVGIIKQFLSEGEKPQREVMEKISHLDIPSNKIKKIKAHLNIKSIKKGEHWYWCLMP